MKTTRTIATAALAGALAFGGAGVAQAAPQQNAGAIGGLVAAAVNLDRTVAIDTVQLVNVDGDVLSDITVDVRNVNILRNVTIDALNNNNIDLRDVVDVTIADNVLVVVVDVL